LVLGLDISPLGSNPWLAGFIFPSPLGTGTLMVVFTANLV